MRFILATLLLAQVILFGIYWLTKMPDNVLVAGVNIKVIAVNDDTKPDWREAYWSLWHDPETGDHTFSRGPFTSNFSHAGKFHQVIWARGDQIYYIRVGNRRLDATKFDIHWRIVKDGKDLKLEYQE